MSKGKCLSLLKYSTLLLSNTFITKNVTVYSLNAKLEMAILDKMKVCKLWHFSKHLKNGFPGYKYIETRTTLLTITSQLPLPCIFTTKII